MSSSAGFGQVGFSPCCVQGALGQHSSTKQPCVRVLRYILHVRKGICSVCSTLNNRFESVVLMTVGLIYVI